MTKRNALMSEVVSEVWMLTYRSSFGRLETEFYANKKSAKNAQELHGSGGHIFKIDVLEAYWHE